MVPRSLRMYDDIILTWLRISSPPYIRAKGPFVSKGSRSSHILCILIYILLKENKKLKKVWNCPNQRLNFVENVLFVRDVCIVRIIWAVCRVAKTKTKTLQLWLSVLSSLSAMSASCSAVIVLSVGNVYFFRFYMRECKHKYIIKNTFSNIFNYHESLIAKFASETPEYSSLTRMYSLMLTKVWKKTTTAAPTITLLSSSSPSKLGQNESMSHVILYHIYTLWAHSAESAEEHSER